MRDGSTELERRCAVCGSHALLPLARRSDGMMVLRCTSCGMGVIETIPADLIALYGDDYYGVGGPQRGDAGQGYEDYAYTAEHGTRWAAALVKLLRPRGGTVLDIGCADGYLLAKLAPNYGVFGIEVNAAMGEIAAGHGVQVLGRDLMDPAILEHHAGRFDVITAIALFEHLRDIRAGMQRALQLLRDDGVLLFEVPLMSATHDNAMWLRSSLEHVWYPSEPGLRRLVEAELGANLIGTELFIAGYASTYVGLVFRRAADAPAIQGIARRVLLREAEPASPEEATARMLLHLVHAATPTHEDLNAVGTLPLADLTPPLVRRFADLWQADLWRLRAASAETERVQAAWEQEVAHARRLQSDLDVAIADRVLSCAELTTGIVAAHARLAAVQADLDVKIAAELALGRRRALLDREQTSLGVAQARLDAETASASARQHAIEAAERHLSEWQSAALAELAASRAVLEAEQAVVRAVQTGGAWRVATILREIAHRYPRVARPARKAARVVWWTVRGRLISRLRQRQHIRTLLRAGRPTVLPMPTLPAPALPSPAATVPAAPPPHPQGAPIRLPATHSAVGTLVLLAATGHRPSARPAESDHQTGDRPLVSVVITSFNYGRFVAAAVDSVLAQTFRDLEVIVVEGGSSHPESRYAVAELLRPRTRVLMQGSGNLPGANRNYGISQARGRYICCLDADDTLAPTYIEKAVYLLERHGYDVVSSALEMVGEDQGVVNIMEQPDLGALLDGNNVLTCAVYRRSLWERAGGYRDVDRSVTGYVYEDWAFWLRLAALGARFRNLYHDPMLRYRVHGRSLSRGKDVLPMWRQRNLVWQMNQDMLQSLPEQVARSRQQAALAYGTPTAPPAPVQLDPAAPPGPRPPTVLLALPFLILGGAERLLSAVVGHLVRRGWRVVITTSIQPGAEHGDTTAWFEQHTDEIFHLPRGLPPELWENFIQHLVRSRQVDLLWVVGSAVAYNCLRGLRALHSGLRVADLLFNTVGHTANNRRRRDLIDLIFVESSEVRGWLLARGEDAARVRLVESGVDLQALCPAERSPALLRQIGAGADDLIVGYSGRWSEEKNPLGFVEIASLVDPSLPVRFVMTGAGHLRSAIEQAVEQAGFPKGRFHVLGPVPELAPVLASFDLLVVPSVLDGRPVVVLEALAMGVPVLASRVGALPDLIEEGRTGWLRGADEPRAFADCIERAARDRAGLRSMRRHARHFAEARLDAQAMLRSYEAGLTSLLPEDRRRD